MNKKDFKNTKLIADKALNNIKIPIKKPKRKLNFTILTC